MGKCVRMRQGANRYMYIEGVLQTFFSKPLRLLWRILVCFIASFFLLCFLSLIVVHYARDFSCTLYLPHSRHGDS